MVTTGIRKVSMPPSMVTAVKELAWKERTSVSALVREILQEFEANPKAFNDVGDTVDRLDAVLTVYVQNDIWYAGRDTAYAHGRIPISVLIRKGLNKRLKQAQDIPA